MTEVIVPAIIIGLVAYAIWTRVASRGKGSTEVLRLMRATPKGEHPAGARSFSCGFRTTEPGAVVGSTGTHRCYVSSDRLYIEGWLGCLRFDRDSTSVRITRPRKRRVVEVSGDHVQLDLYPTRWRSGVSLLTIHKWLEPGAAE